jgi:hypothetical protein
MSTKSIEELADDYALRFIQDYTNYPTDGKQHRALTALFEQFSVIVGSITIRKSVD